MAGPALGGGGLLPRKIRRLFPARSLGSPKGPDRGMVQTQLTAQGWLGSTPEGRRPQIRGWRAGGSLAVASSTPATPPSSATRNCVCFACMIYYDLLRFPGFLKSWRAVFFFTQVIDG